MLKIPGLVSLVGETVGELKDYFSGLDCKSEEVEKSGDQPSESDDYKVTVYCLKRVVLLQSLPST